MRFDSPELHAARRVLGRVDPARGEVDVGPVICARNLLIAAYAFPDHTRSLLDAAAALLPAATVEPDPEAYGYPHLDLQTTSQLSMADARLWFGIVEWMRGLDSYAELLEQSAIEFTLIATTYTRNAIVKVGRARSELLSGMVRLGCRDRATIDRCFQSAAAAFEAAGQPDRTRVLERVLEAGGYDYAATSCGFLRGEAATVEPVLATRDADAVRRRYREQEPRPVARPPRPVPTNRVRCPRCRTVHEVPGGQTVTCDCSARLRMPAPPVTRTVRCPRCRSVHSVVVGSTVRCRCTAYIRAPTSTDAG